MPARNCHGRAIDEGMGHGVQAQQNVAQPVIVACLSDELIELVNRAQQVPRVLAVADLLQIGAIQAAIGRFNGFTGLAHNLPFLLEPPLGAFEPSLI